MLERLYNLLAHRSRVALRSRLRKHDILEHYQENKRIVPDELDLSAIHALFWELSISFRHRLLTSKELEESLDHRLISLEHEIQELNEDLHGHGHTTFVCPKGCRTSTTINVETFHHPRCPDCGAVMVPEEL